MIWLRRLEEMKLPPYTGPDMAFGQLARRGHGKSRLQAEAARAFARSRPDTVTRVLVVGAAGDREVVLGPNGQPVIDVAAK